MLSSLDNKAVAYATTSFASAMMGSAFNYYYVKVFLNYYNVTESWFQVSQVVYMIWNTVNDPLFGYMQDNLDYYWAKSRRHSILYGAPFFGLSFLLAWIPWSRTNSIISGLHLMFTLCFYDTLFTFVLLAHCSLFAELSRKHGDRVRLIKYSQYARLLGSTSVFFCEYFSENLKHFFNFQAACFVVAVVSSICMIYTGRNAETEYDILNIPISNIKPGDVDPQSSAMLSGLKHAWKQTWQVLKERDFLSFVLMNFFQTYHSYYLAGFAMIICDQMISEEMLPSFSRSIFYGSLSFAPQVVTIVMVPVMRSAGYYRVVMGSFILKVTIGIAFYMSGPHPHYLMCFFFIDTHPLSSMVFASNALVTKPAISIAPMVTVWILNKYGYYLVKSGDAASDQINSELNNAMFHLAAFTSILLGLVQALIWSYYRIRNSYKVISKYTEVDSDGFPHSVTGTDPQAKITVQATKNA